MFFATQHRSSVSETSRRWKPVAATALCAALLAGCASQPAQYASNGYRGRAFDPRLGVYASPRLVDDGQPVPRGGGSYLVGRPYTIAGRSFYPNEHPEGYAAVGMASWYGDAFHGRRTANGEIFDKNSISAAHPTLPLPSYVRVTNTGNGRSMIVRVNDRGPIMAAGSWTYPSASPRPCPSRGRGRPGFGSNMWGARASAARTTASCWRRCATMACRRS